MAEGNKMTIVERVNKVFLEVLAKIPSKEYSVPSSVEEIDPDADIMEDYYFDAADWMELILALEEEFVKIIFDHDYSRLNTVRDFHNYFEDMG